MIDGVPPNAENAWAEAINNAGVVAVQAWVPKADKPKQIRWEVFRWAAPGRISTHRVGEVHHAPLQPANRDGLPD